jgi:putative ABC transport system permease protein
VPSGFSSSHLLTMQMDEIGHRYDDDGVRYRFWTQALEAVNRVPGVSAAAFASQLPLSGDLDKYGVAFERDNNPGAAEDTFRYAVTPGYLETISIPLRRGRLLDRGDRAGAPLVALINESFAKRKFGAQDPIGQRIHIGPTDTWYTIVGVVGDVRQMSVVS